MVFVNVSGEFLRFQVSDNTVRFPNTKSFLSQYIYIDNLQPLGFGNDIGFYGGNTPSNAYTEYFGNN